MSVFLLVTANFDTLPGDTTRHWRRRKFDGMGKGHGRGVAHAATLYPCGGILACPLWPITAEKPPSTARPAHYTLRECLIYNRGLTRSVADGGLLDLPQCSVCEVLFYSCSFHHANRPAC